MDPSGTGRETWFDPGDRAQKESQRKKKKVLEREKRKEGDPGLRYA